MHMNGKVVVVTGGAEGIGAALSRRAAREGARVMVADIDAAGAKALAADIEGLARACDVAREEDMIRLVRHTEEKMGPIDFFFSNAGIIVKGDLEVSNADWQRIWEINVMAHVYAARAVVPGMLQRGGGWFVCTASAAGLLSQIGSAPYSVTKHAAVGFAENLAITYGDQGLKVAVVCPQAVRTEMTRQGGGVAAVDGMIEADQVADCVMAALQGERFMVLPHPEVKDYMQRKTSDYDRWIRGMQRLKARFQPGSPATPTGSDAGDGNCRRRISIRRPARPKPHSQPNAGGIMDPILVEQKGHTAVVTINHPPANAWNLATMEAFEACVNALEADDQVRVILLTGAGDRCFSAGFDVKDAANGPKIGALGRSLWTRLDRFAKPVIAAINGFALGGGLELALSCHFRIMADAPKIFIGLTELNLGIIPGWGGTQRLTQVVGKAKALDMILFSKTVNAKEALAIGLVNQIAAPDKLMEEALAFADRLAQRPPIAVGCVLKAMSTGIYEGLERGLEVELEGSRTVRTTEDCKEGFTAFLEKRPPVFKGR